MASIKAYNSFKTIFAETLNYSKKEYGETTAKKFYQAYVNIRKRLARFPLSSPRESLLKRYLRPYRSTIIMKNWKIIYRYDETYDRVILVDLWDMRMSTKRLLRQFKRHMWVHIINGIGGSIRNILMLPPFFFRIIHWKNCIGHIA